jgi:hypothetical protein
MSANRLSRAARAFADSLRLHHQDLWTVFHGGEAEGMGTLALRCNARNGLGRLPPGFQKLCDREVREAIRGGRHQQLAEVILKMYYLEAGLKIFEKARREQADHAQGARKATKTRAENPSLGRTRRMILLEQYERTVGISLTQRSPVEARKHAAEATHQSLHNLNLLLRKRSAKFDS